MFDVQTAALLTSYDKCLNYNFQTAKMRKGKVDD